MREERQEATDLFSSRSLHSVAKCTQCRVIACWSGRSCQNTWHPSISTFGKRRKVALARLTDPRQTAIEWNGTKRLGCKSDIAVKLRTALSNWGAGWQVCIWGATKDIGCRVTAPTSSTAAICVKKVSMCNIYSQGRTNFVSKRLNNLQYFLTEDIRVDIRVSLSCREGSRTPICICVEIDFRSVMIFEGCCCWWWKTDKDDYF